MEEAVEARLARRCLSRSSLSSLLDTSFLLGFTVSPSDEPAAASASARFALLETLVPAGEASRSEIAMVGRRSSFLGRPGPRLGDAWSSWWAVNEFDRRFSLGLDETLAELARFTSLVGLEPFLL